MGGCSVTSDVLACVRRFIVSSGCQFHLARDVPEKTSELSRAMATQILFGCSLRELKRR